MKKQYRFILIILILFIVPAIIIGQSSILSDLNFHSFLGLNSSKIISDMGDGDSRMGFDFGMGIEKDCFGFPVVARIVFSQRGAKWDWGYSDEWYSDSWETKERLNYLSFPVMVKYPIQKGYVSAGPQLSFLLGGKEKWEHKSDGMTEEGEWEVKDHKKSFDFGLIFGGGYPIPCKWRTMMIEVTYYLGLFDIYDPPAEEDSDESYKNRSLIIGITVPITKK
jgi:hypothetical protein